MIHQQPPQRDHRHEALGIFIGSWKAAGSSYGGPEQSPSDPKAHAEPWTSTHKAYWHTGEFFLIQDELAHPGGSVFDTLSILGVDEESGQYFAQCFENHGYRRHYAVENKGSIWKFVGETERATITFSDDGLHQTIEWEWRPKTMWLPLCDRIATRTA